jgi:hypothetical protein
MEKLGLEIRQILLQLGICAGCDMPRSHNNCMNCQSHEKWITNWRQFAQKTRSRILAVHAIVFAYRSRLSLICQELCGIYAKVREVDA